jgi:hypothetical protein
MLVFMRVQTMSTPNLPNHPNPFLARYDDMDAKPMEVISHLYYRMCVEQLGEHMPEYGRVNGMRSWTGGPKARVPAQSVAYVNPAVDPPLALAHVLEVLDWLFAEVRVVSGSAGSEVPPEMTHLLPSERPQYLTRLQCVNAQPIAAGLRNTKHRPYDMLAAVFLCADCMRASDAQKQKLRGYEHIFMQMYLNQSTEFDYQRKDIFSHNRVYAGAEHQPLSPLGVFVGVVGVGVLVFLVFALFVARFGAA